MRPAARRGNDVAAVKKQDVNVALRVQFAPAVTADGHQGKVGLGAFGFHADVGLQAVQHVTQEQVQHRGACPADFPPAGAGTMQHFQPVGFDLEEILVARQFLGRLAARRKRQTFGGAGFDLLRQGRHRRNLVPRFINTTTFVAFIKLLAGLASLSR